MRALKLDEKWQPREIASAVSCIRDRLLSRGNKVDIKR